MKPTYEEIKAKDDAIEHEKERVELCRKHKICPDCGKTLDLRVDVVETALLPGRPYLYYKCTSCKYQYRFSPRGSFTA